MAFRFRLEKVARYRQQLVDEQGQRVAEAGRVVSVLHNRLAALEEDISDQLRDFADPAADRISVQGMMARAAWVSHLENMREDVQRELEVARAELDRERARLNEVWRDLEVLNRLRTRQAAEWHDEQHRRENRELDEIGQVRAERQRRAKVAS